MTFRSPTAVPPRSDPPSAGLWAAPRPGAVEADDEAFVPEDDTDLGLDTGGAEEVGLDASTGLDDPPEELPDLGGDEAIAWSADAEAADDLADLEESAPSQEAEYGWTEGNEAPDEDWEDGALDGGDEPPPVEDGGEEGLVDDGFSLDSLPELDLEQEAALQGESEQFEAELLRDLTTHVGAEAQLEVAPGEHWPMLEPASSRWRQLSEQELALWEGGSAASPSPDFLLRAADVELQMGPASEGGPRVRLGSSPWAQAPAIEPPACLVDEEGEVYLYGCLTTPAGRLLLRRPLDGARAPTVLRVLDGGELQGARSLSGSHQEGITTMVVRTPDAAYLLELSLDGGKLP